MSNRGQSPQIILLIQDDVADARAVWDALANKVGDLFTIEWVRNCSEGLQRLARANDPLQTSKGIAAVMLDLYLDDSQGIATFDRVFEAVPLVPILVLIAADREETAELAVKRGAQDFLLKERLDNYWLPKALRNMVERGSIINSLFEEKERADVTLNSIGHYSVGQIGEPIVLRQIGHSKRHCAGRADIMKHHDCPGDIASPVVYGGGRILDGSLGSVASHEDTVGSEPDCPILAHSQE